MTWQHALLLALVMAGCTGDLGSPSGAGAGPGPDACAGADCLADAGSPDDVAADARPLADGRPDAGIAGDAAPAGADAGSCGDDVCAATESCAACPHDCGTCGACTWSYRELPASGPLYNPGPLPADLDIQWPTLPQVQQELTVSDAAALSSALGQGSVRVRVTAAIGADASIGRSDVELVIEPGASLGHVHVATGLARIRVTGGGEVRSIEMAIPSSEAVMTTDVVLDNLHVVAPQEGQWGGSALMLRGKRIAVINDVVHSYRYGIWCGDVDPYQSQDLVIAGNDFLADAPEATIRLVSARRTVTVDNRLENGMKHNYRVHGVSDLNYAARNVLVTTGTMFGTMDGDDLGRFWFNANTFHHTAPDLFNPGVGRIDHLEARDNVAYTDVWSTFGGGATAPGWVVVDNQVLPYQPPPCSRQ